KLVRAQFPVLSRRNAKRDLAHPENREIAGVLERGLVGHGAGDASRYTSRLDQRSPPCLPLSSGTKTPSASPARSRQAARRFGGRVAWFSEFRARDRRQTSRSPFRSDVTPPAMLNARWTISPAAYVPD